MKKIIFTLITVCLCQLCHAQWLQVFQDNLSYFYDAAFPSESKAYVAASDTNGAYVLRTNDGGANWNKKYIPGWNYIDRITMLDSNKGYLIRGGAPGLILKTSDGFNTYTMFTTDSSFTVRSLAVLNDSVGFFLNNAARLRKFRNHGASITHIIDTLNDAQGLQFFSARSAYLDDGSRLFRTNDTGASWNLINNNMGFSSAAFRFADSSHAFFSDGQAIYTTSDGGLNFQSSFTFPGAYSLAVEGSFCIVANDTGNIAFTLNGGQNWQTESSGINFLAAEPYQVFRAPGGSCYLFSQFCGEIRKREAIILQVNDRQRNIIPVIFPNPAHDRIHILLPNSLQHAELKLLNLSGQVVRVEPDLNGQSYSLERKDLPAGTYVIVLRQQDQLLAQRLAIFAD